MESKRERRWRVIEAIGARNRDKDPEEVERDIAEAIAEVRAEQRSLMSPELQAAFGRIWQENEAASATSPITTESRTRRSQNCHPNGGPRNSLRMTSVVTVRRSEREPWIGMSGFPMRRFESASDSPSAERLCCASHTFTSGTSASSSSRPTSRPFSRSHAEA
jgi:hypothetical protein